MGFPCGSAGKESSHNADLGSIPGLGRSLGERKAYPFHYSALENSMDWGRKRSDTTERLSLSLSFMNLRFEIKFTGERDRI